MLFTHRVSSLVEELQAVKYRNVQVNIDGSNLVADLSLHINGYFGS